MKNKLTLVITMAVILFSGVVFADYCTDRLKVCHDDYIKDLAYCAKQGDGEKSCIQRAEETYNSCTQGCP